MKTMQERYDHVMLYVKTVAKWLIVAFVIGGIGGVLGTLFHLGVEYATLARERFPAILWLLPLAGVLIVLLYRLLRTQGMGTNNILDAVANGDRLPFVLIPSIFFGTILTHLCGGSAGREGAALQIGGDLGELLARAFRLDARDTSLATMCGMSALFSALFGTPLTAAVFALEVVSVGSFHYSGLLPCILSALIGYAVSLALGVAPTRFSMTAPVMTLRTMALTFVLAALAALVSILFCEVIHKAEHFAHKMIGNDFVRIIIGGLLVIGMTLLVGCRDYNGAGMDIITQAIAGQAKPAAFLLKILFTAATLGFGFKGGEVVPTFFVGSAFGCVVGSLLGLPGGFGAAVGLVCVFCGAVNCPLASLILSIELFGADAMLFFALAVTVSYVLSGYRGLYSSQLIHFSKLRFEEVNIHSR